MLSGSTGEGQWIVPITLCVGTYDARKSFLLQSKTEALDVKEFLDASTSSGHPWIKVNVDQTGFFRVKYDEDLSALLRTAIERKSLSTNDKYGELISHLLSCLPVLWNIYFSLFVCAGILDDYYSLSMACQQPLSSLLTLMGAFREEIDYTVLSNLISVMFLF